MDDSIFGGEVNGVTPMRFLFVRIRYDFFTLAALFGVLLCVHSLGCGNAVVPIPDSFTMEVFSISKCPGTLQIIRIHQNREDLILVECNGFPFYDFKDRFSREGQTPETGEKNWELELPHNQKVEFVGFDFRGRGWLSRSDFIIFYNELCGLRPTGARGHYSAHAFQFSFLPPFGAVGCSTISGPGLVRCEAVFDERLDLSWRKTFSMDCLAWPRQNVAWTMDGDYLIREEGIEDGHLKRPFKLLQLLQSLAPKVMLEKEIMFETYSEGSEYLEQLIESLPEGHIRKRAVEARDLFKIQEEPPSDS